jgi:hypothetical protein
MDGTQDVLAGQGANAGQADAADAGPWLLALEIDGFDDASSSPAVGDQIGLPEQIPIADLAPCMAELHASPLGFGPDGRSRAFLALTEVPEHRRKIGHVNFLWFSRHQTVNVIHEFLQDDPSVPWIIPPGIAVAKILPNQLFLHLGGKFVNQSLKCLGFSTKEIVKTLSGRATAARMDELPGPEHDQPPSEKSNPTE